MNERSISTAQCLGKAREEQAHRASPWAVKLSGTISPPLSQGCGSQQLCAAMQLFRKRFPRSQACLSAFLWHLSSSRCSVVELKLCFLESGPFPTMGMETGSPDCVPSSVWPRKSGDGLRKQYRETSHIRDVRDARTGFLAAGVGIWHRLAHRL